MTLDSHFLNLKCAVVPATETKILMPRGSTFQMRVRRRQSDAKWRASVATCYETLKNIIPNRDKMPKRKISKALILQETENHIVNIENKFRDLLEEKAKAKGKSLVMQTEYGFVEAKLEDIRKEFSVKQENLYLQNCSQRKKSNIPSDLELGLIDLRSSMCNLSVVPSDCLQEFLNSSNSNDFCETLNKETSREDTKPSENLSSEASTESLRGRVENLKVQQDLDVAAECPTLPPRTPVKSRRGRPSTRRQMGQYRFERVVSPEHSNISENCSSFTSENFHRGQHDVPFECNSFHRRDKTPSQTRKRGHDSSSRSRTPARSTKQRLFESHSGFTPVKLPDLVSMTPRTPRSTPQQSPFTILSSDNNQQESPVRDEICAAPDQLFSPLDTASLLCTESMDLMDLDDGHQSNENTPHNDKRKKSKENARSKGINKSHGHRSSQKKNHPNEEKHRQARRCRRQLEKSFPTPEKHTLNTETPLITGVFENTDINGCQDFDGYFQFYQQMAAEYPETPETASRVAQMWRNMSPDSRDTFVAMAALDSQSVTSILSDFSDDLRDLELDPIIDCFQPSDQEESTPQCVPEYSGESPHQPGVDSRTFQTVPESPSDLSTYLKMGPGDPVARDHQHTYQDMFDSAAFNAGSIYQAAYMISANQFLDQSSGVQTLGNQSSTMSESSQAVPDIDLVLDHLIQVEDFRIPTS